jgi:dimethylglycine dehydrogenase
MLAHSGKLMGDLTTLRLAEDRFLISGSGYLQAWHMRWFDEYLSGEGVHVRNISEHNAGLAVFGPHSRELLQRLTRSDVSNEGLAFMSLIEADIGFAPARVARLSVTGELGYEIHLDTPYLRSLLLEVLRLGSDLGIRQVGMYALNSLRLEKSFGIWSREFSRDYTPRMAGLQRFIDYDRAGFIGRDAALRDRDQTPGRRLVTLEIDTSDADASGYEPILLHNELVGFVTSGGYGHCVGRSLAMGYLDSNIPVQQVGLEVAVNGKPHACKVSASAVWDPQGARMRQ